MGFEQAEEDQSLRHRRKYSLSRKSKSDKKNEKKCHSYDSVTEEGLDSHWQDLQKTAVLSTAVLHDLQRFDRA